MHNPRSNSRGGGSAPSEEYGKAFDTEEEAIAYVARCIADQNPERDDVRKLFFITGCLKESPVHEPEKPDLPQQENEAQPVECDEQELEPGPEDFMVPEQVPEPEAVEPQEEVRFKFNKIQGVTYVKGLLEQKIRVSISLKEDAEMRKDFYSVNKEMAKTAYMNELLKRVEQDLFDLSGENMSKE